ncbi:MAG: DUF1906 domain-containing protein [Streptomycetaceae bacterium]|nr:DUF1906 domain-containing protein [Streptomycetaceae bacterium]
MPVTRYRWPPTPLSRRRGAPHHTPAIATRPGFYGFASSSAADIAKAAAQGAADMPDALWYAKYDGAADTTGSFPYALSLFTGHRRAHQYQVNSRETYGGATVTVDRNAWDAPVAVTG